MKPFIQIAISSGHVYEIPTQVIAENRAKAMLELHPDEFADMAAAMEDTVELFDDNFAVSDWAINNMNPSDYLPASRLIRFTPPEQDFGSAAWSCHDAPAIVGELDGETIMQSPIEFVASVMAASRQLCGVTICNSPDGSEQVGVAVFIGTPTVVQSFTNVLQDVSGKIAGQSCATPAQSH